MLNSMEVNVDSGAELVRFAREIRGPGAKVVTVAFPGSMELQEGAWVFLKSFREALVEGCEDIRVEWYLGRNDSEGDGGEQTKQGLERVFGRENRAKGIMGWLFDGHRTGAMV